MLIPARQMGQPHPWQNTSLAHDSQKYWWPHQRDACVTLSHSKLISHYLRRLVTFRFPYFVVPAFFSLAFFHPMQSGPAFSTLAVWCRVFQSRIFLSRIFSAPEMAHICMAVYVISINVRSKNSSRRCRRWR